MQGALWMRVAGPSSVITSLTASGRSIYTSSLNGEWGFWSLDRSMPSIRDRFDNSRRTAYCSVLSHSTLKLLSGANGIVEWEPLSNSFERILLLDTTTIKYIDASQDDNLIASYSVDDYQLHLFNRSLNKEIKAWPSASGPVRFIDNDHSMLSAINKSLVKIEIESQKIVHSYPFFTSPPWVIAINPKRGDVFATVSSRGAHEMDTAGNILSHWEGINTQPVQDAMAYSPDGSVIAAGTGALIIMNPSNGSLFQIQSPYSVYHVSFLNNDTVAASGETDVSLYSIKENRYLGSLDGQNWTIRGLAFSNNGDWLVSGSRDESVMLWETASGIRKRKLRCPKNISCVAVSKDASTIIAGLKNVQPDGTDFKNVDSVLIWATNSDSAEIMTLPSPTIGIWSTEYLPDDSTFVIAADSLYEINSRTHKIIWQYDMTKLVYCYSHNGEKVGLTDRRDDTLRVYDRFTHETVAAYYTPGILLSASFSDDDTKLIITRAIPYQFEIHTLVNDQAVIVPYNSDYWPAGMVLLHGNDLGVVQSDSGLLVFNVNSGLLTKTIRPPDNTGPFLPISSIKVSSVALNPVTGDFATGEDDGSVIVWKALGNSKVATSFPHPFESFDAVVFNNRIEIQSLKEQQVYVYSIDGRCLWSSPFTHDKITTTPLPNGVYFVILVNERGERAFRKVSIF